MECKIHPSQLINYSCVNEQCKFYMNLYCSQCDSLYCASKSHQMKYSEL